MSHIPLLNPIPNKDCPVDTFYQQKGEEHLFEHLKKDHSYGIIDIFPKQLELNSNEVKKLDSDYFRLSHEELYLKFIEKIFNLNNKKCIIRVNLFSQDTENITNVLNKMDDIDKTIFIHQLLNICKIKEYSYFRIKDIQLLKSFFRLILREIIDAEIHFLTSELIFFSNYDLSIPVIIKDSDDIKTIEGLAKDSSLHLRDLNIK